MVERDTGRPRGFGFITFTDHRDVDDAIREMHGRELGDRTITVNKAQPKMGGNDDHGLAGAGGYTSGGGRGNYGSRDRTLGQDDCFKCGRPGHWARDCPSGGGWPGRGGGRFASHSRFGRPGGGADRFGDHERHEDDRHDNRCYGGVDRYESRDSKYGGFERYDCDMYTERWDRYGSDRNGASGRYARGGYGKEGEYDSDVPPPPPRGISGRYGAGGPARDEGRSYGSRSCPYDRPSRGGYDHPSRGGYDRPSRGGGRSQYDRY